MHAIMAWTFGLIAAAVIAFLWLRSRKAANPGLIVRGLKQFARDPGAMRRVDQAFAQRERLLAAADSMTDDQLREGVQHLLGDDRNRQSTYALVFQRIGRRAEPFLLQALDDPRCQSQETPHDFRLRSPFEAVTEALANIGSEALIPRLLPLTQSPDEKQRKHAALCIAAVGAPASIEPTLAALRDPAEYVRSYAMMGCSRATANKHASPAFRAAIVDALLPLAAGETPFSALADDKAAGCIADLDPARAAAQLPTARFLRPDNPLLSHLLDTLGKLGITAPPDLLHPILRHADGRTEYPWPRTYGAALQALAKSDPPAARPLIDRALAGPDAGLAADAADALRILLHLPGLYDFPRVDDAFANLPRPVQHVITTRELEDEVNNGGLGQYFFNSAGDHWPIALEALHAMNTPHIAGLLERAIATFGPKGPSLDRTTRIKQYGRLGDAADSTLNSLSSEFYKTPDRLAVQRIRYMAAHADEVRSVASPT